MEKTVSTGSVLLHAGQVKRTVASTACLGLVWLLMPPPIWAAPSDLIPPATGLKQDRPRLLLRPGRTPFAITLPQLKALSRDQDYQQLLRQLENLQPPRAAALALVYHLTGRTEAADKAVAVMESWQTPRDKKAMDDPFNVYFTCTDLALAYDWLHDHPRFGAQARANLRRKLLPFVENAFALGNDHVFHNYIWMYNGGAMLWALATAGEDPASDRLLAELSDRFNRQLFRAMEYLDGANGDSAGYWWLYCENSAVLVLLAAQSAFETDVMETLRRGHGDWLNRQLDFLVHSVLPDMRFAPWGDIVAGPNGGATREMAASIDAQAWALRSPRGTFLSRWLAGKRGLRRYEGDTAMFHFLYSRHLEATPAPPPLAMLAGNKQGGSLLMRSGWDEGATIVGFRCTDFFGQHHHLDQGSFFIYRNGMLALDAGLYQRVAGSQMNTDAHNTLLFGGEGQRPQRYQSASTLEAFTQRLPKGLETGDILFYREAGAWTAVAGQFAQAYQPEVVKSCVRQLLFLPPGTVIVVDQLAAPEGKTLPEVRWLLNVPGRPEIGDSTVTTLNPRSYLRCRALEPGCRAHVEDSYRTPAGPSTSAGTASVLDASRAVFAYEGKARLTLVHALEVGDGQPPPVPTEIKTLTAGGAEAITVLVDGKPFKFSTGSSFEIRGRE
jgi:hypothetical protein